MSDIEPRLTAVLGPTNTGKTYFAIERMVAHRSGMIGFPLRLLARENYDRVVKLKGAGQVALITGEERIVPSNPRYFLCTVEAMPVDRPVDFLAIDEIQMIADRERGHVFTDRLLHARGAEETMFLGSAIAAKVIRRLVPGVDFVTRPRLSRLTYTGPRRLSRLPRRSAAVAFSGNDVYALAEQMRRRQGGVAIVMGALSPRTRNAQVEMYQAGEVDFLVATDAIGMGLNLSLNHVAFAGLVKFDGRSPRPLTAHEIGQIAGRAGRYLNDGTFGTTNDVGAFDQETIDAVEGHVYQHLTGIYWRNAALDFTSLAGLRRSLDAPPPDPVLIRGPVAPDQAALTALAEHDDIRDRAKGHDNLRLLWEVCQVPDFRKILSDHHAGLLARLYRHLTDGPGKLPADWVAKQIATLDRPDGDIETLMQRIAFIRTWTYISHRGDWLDDSGAWQARTRQIEDRLSDALHDRLTQRFVDRRAARLARGRAQGGPLNTAVTAEGEVVVEGEAIGTLAGFRFQPDAAARGEDARTLQAAARQTLADEIARRVADCLADNDKSLTLDPSGAVLWRGAPVARLEKGADILSPSVHILNSEFLDADSREALRQRLVAWTQKHIAGALQTLVRMRDGTGDLSGPAKGLVFQLVESLGTLPRRRVAEQLGTLTKPDRDALAAYEVRFGVEAVYLAAMTKPRHRPLRAVLWSLFHETPGPCLPADAQAYKPLSLPLEAARAQGFVAVGEYVVRADILERFLATVRRLSRRGPLAPTEGLAKLVGLEPDDLGGLLPALGFRRHAEGESVTYVAKEPKGRPTASHKKTGPPKAKGKKKPPPRRPAIDPDSPFAKLAELKLGK